MIATQPALEPLEVGGVTMYIRERHLMRAPRALDLVSADLLRARPALGGAQHDHRPARKLCFAALARLLLNRADLRNDGVQRGRHLLMHLVWLRTFDEVGLVAVTDEQRLEVLVSNARQHGGVRDFVAIEVEDGQHGAIAYGIEKLVRKPGGRQRTSLRLTIAHHACDDEIGIVERGTVGMRQAVAELP